MRVALILLLALLPAPTLAGPEVVATIAPVHSLVARVMQGAGTPHLLLPPGASPHDHALRPSDAAALERAGLVFRVGAGLEVWLDGPLSALAGKAQVVTLSDVPGVTRLRLRDDPDFAAHDHADDSAHAENETDPHLWLDTENAKAWIEAIAAALAGADPSNRALYYSNAAAARAELDALGTTIAARLAPLADRPFLVFHDGFQYFERRFGLAAAGAVALSDARPPGPARIAAVRSRIRALGAACLFREPQFRSGLVDTVAAGTGARIGVLDPLGAALEPGPDLYPALLSGLADTLADCLS